MFWAHWSYTTFKTHEIPYKTFVLNLLKALSHCKNGQLVCHWQWQCIIINVLVCTLFYALYIKGGSQGGGGQVGTNIFLSGGGVRPKGCPMGDGCGIKSVLGMGECPGNPQEILPLKSVLWVGLFLIHYVLGVGAGATWCVLRVGGAKKFWPPLQIISEIALSINR